MHKIYLVQNDKCGSLSGWCSNGTALIATMQITNIADLSILKLDLFFFDNPEISLIKATSPDVLLETLSSFIYNFTEAIKRGTLYNCCKVLKIRIVKEFVITISADCKQPAFVQILFSMFMEFDGTTN